MCCGIATRGSRRVPRPRKRQRRSGLASRRALPVICSRSGLHLERLGGPDQAQNAALTVEENDPQALAKAMIEIMQDAEPRHRLAQCGRALAPSTGLQHMADQACALFEAWLRALGTGAPAPAEKTPDTREPVAAQRDESS